MTIALQNKLQNTVMLHAANYITTLQKVEEEPTFLVTSNTNHVTRKVVKRGVRHAILCLRHDCHACGSKTAISRLLTPAFPFLLPGGKV